MASEKGEAIGQSHGLGFFPDTSMAEAANDHSCGTALSERLLCESKPEFGLMSFISRTISMTSLGSILEQKVLIQLGSRLKTPPGFVILLAFSGKLRIIFLGTIVLVHGYKFYKTLSEIDLLSVAFKIKIQLSCS